MGAGPEKMSCIIQLTHDLIRPACIYIQGSQGEPLRCVRAAWKAASSLPHMQKPGTTLKLFPVLNSTSFTSSHTAHGDQVPESAASHFPSFSAALDSDAPPAAHPARSSIMAARAKQCFPLRRRFPEFISFHRFLLQILIEERLQLVERNRVLAAAVIEISGDCIRNDHQFLVIRILAVSYHVRIGVP